MTDRQFLKRMIALTKKLCAVYNVEPLDQEARLAVLDEIHETGARFNRSRRRRPWGTICFLLFLIYCLAWIVWSIFF